MHHSHTNRNTIAATSLHQAVLCKQWLQGALKRGKWEDLHYKGDWMRRPIGSNEIGWLVRLLLKLSDLLNHLLYLDGRQPPSPASPSTALVSDVHGGSSPGNASLLIELNSYCYYDVVLQS